MPPGVRILEPLPVHPLVDPITGMLDLHPTLKWDNPSQRLLFTVLWAIRNSFLVSREKFLAFCEHSCNSQANKMCACLLFDVD